MNPECRTFAPKTKNRLVHASILQSEKSLEIATETETEIETEIVSVSGIVTEIPNTNYVGLSCVNSC